MENIQSTILTIGYEGSSIDDFVAALEAYGVDHIADVRDIPISRKKGFSKKLLAERLSNRGINYTHFKQLGDPKPGREAARRGEISLFKQIYCSVISSEEGQHAVAAISDLAKGQRVCLLCYERLPKDCHRSIIADEIKRKVGAHILHVGVPNGENARSIQRRSVGIGKSVAACWQ